MKKYLFFLFALLIADFSCQKATKLPKEVTVHLGAYTVPKEAYQKEIIPAFQKYWFEKTGQKVKFVDSYLASGTQSRSIIAGFEADLAVLSLEQDVERIRQAGLITHDWKARAYQGFVTRSVVVIGYRPNNPKQIKKWEDLTRQGVEVLYPNPLFSGGAMWDINAIYGAGLKLSELKTGQANPNQAYQLLRAVQSNVKAMHKSGRESIDMFLAGIGDVIVTYENEICLKKSYGYDLPHLVPETTILIENPIALVDKYVDKHQNREVAEAFLNFVVTEEMQRAFGKHGFRAVNPKVAAEFAAQYPEPKYLFDIHYLGGWPQVMETIYGPRGAWTKIMKELTPTPSK